MAFRHIPVISAGERALAAILLLILLPLLFVVCLLALMLSRRSPLVAHRRVGKGGKPIWVYKVRTMWSGKNPPDTRFRFIEFLKGTEVPECKCRVDPRVTSRVAVLWRRYSIDEMPQLWLVMTGEMSMVGPRPMTEGELVRHYGADSSRILQAKPGLTGLWQIRGRSKLNYRQRRRLDLFMLKKWSLALYAAILFATVPKVFLGKDAW
ncbi:MAG: sugar transferase [Acidobacteriaceae bacterium]|nr:sugar transferase [Acidobacteriaceae bacterium]